MKIKKKLIPLLIFFMALIALDKVNAEDDVLRELQEKYGQKGEVGVDNYSAVFSYVSIYNAGIVSNDGGNLKLGFDVYNSKNYQPKAVYAVMLYRQENENKPEIADYKIYSDDAFGIREGETVHKELAYAPPVYLNGKYKLNLEIKSDSGFGIAYFPLGEVEIKGGANGQGREVSQEMVQQSYANYENFYLINSLLDTDTYKAGNSANISVFWGANPSIEKEQLNGASLKVALKDENGQLCAPEATEQLDIKKMPEHSLLVSVEENCVNPSVEVEILDKAGDILTSNISGNSTKKSSEYASKNEVVQTADSWWFDSVKSGIWKYLVVMTGIVIIVILVIFFARKKGVFVAIFFLAISLMIINNSDSALAYSFGGFTGNFIVNTDKVCYTPGSAVTVNSTAIGAWTWLDCEFYLGLYTKYFPTGEARTIRLYSPACGSAPYSYTTIFTAPATAGTYQIGFNGWANGVSYPTPASYDVHKLSFTVGNPANGVCGASNGGSFPSAPSSGLCSSGTATSVVPVYSGGGGGLDTGSGTITGWSWSCLGSCGGTNASCSATKSYSCTGTIPANAASYDAEESTGLAADTAWTYSATDTATKCQFGCGSGYSWNGSACVATCTYSDHSCVYTPSIDCSNSSNCGLTGSNVASCYAIDSCTGNTVVRPLSECTGGSGTCSNTTITCPACPTGLEGYKEVAP